MKKLSHIASFNLLLMAAAIPSSGFAAHAYKDGDIQKTTSGSIFTRVDANGIQGWKDEARMIWLDQIGEGMTLGEADDFCRSQSARLPHPYDFERMGPYMGDSAESSYVPQIFDKFGGHTFWIIPNWSESGVIGGGFANPTTVAYKVKAEPESPVIGRNIVPVYSDDVQKADARCVITPPVPTAKDRGFELVTDRLDLDPFLGLMWKRGNHIWGSIAKDKQGKQINMTLAQAKNYCESLGTSGLIFKSGKAIGAKVPSFEEALEDFPYDEYAGLSFIDDDMVLTWTTTPNPFTGHLSYRSSANHVAYYQFKAYGNSADTNVIPALREDLKGPVRCLLIVK